MSTMFLRRRCKNGLRFLNRIDTTDETCVNVYDSGSRRESMIWKRTASPPPKKATVGKSSKKIMCIFFMGCAERPNREQRVLPKGTLNLFN